ncbi:MAG: L-seryl-tRNA(Sec) selenium transferase [Deltaproteobacteria bacterium]|nr:L-seryl-tRNA(Sec) selenium transferase [Deltaproteobacteria bacterium]MBW2361814.1 L-seryl-tRNA(Sec) selenium transferase [Deltaproteobacteria bacterium]
METEREVKSDPRRGLPSVERLARAVRQTGCELPDWALRDAARGLLEEERERVRVSSGAATLETLIARARERAEALCQPHPRRVVNATGIVLHTNLGRAPLAPGAAQAVAAAAAGYSDLEFDLPSGKRGDRQAAVAAKLARLGGCEAALVVNNNAAAVLLALNTLARDREVIVSRGELVEIGGSFRVPEIMQRAGVKLVEVGSTNRTHAGDYADSVGPDTALLLKVHRSNFALSGFTAEVGLPELAAIGAEHGLPLLEDLGSGTFVELPGLPREAFVPARLQLGADLVCFSGDKLLGGPQSGLLLGSAERISELRRNPLARALRLDKLSLAALDWTLEAYLVGTAERDLPVLRQLSEPIGHLEKRARVLAERLAKLAGASARVEARAEPSPVGGGSVPGLELPGWVVAVEPAAGAERVVGRLRAAAVPVVARVRDAKVLLDVRTLLDGDADALEQAFRHALR